MQWTLQLDVAIGPKAFKLDAVIADPIVIGNNLIRITRALTGDGAAEGVLSTPPSMHDLRHLVPGPRFYIDASAATLSAAARIEGAFNIEQLSTSGEVSLLLNDVGFDAHAYALLHGVVGVRLEVSWLWDFTSFKVKGSIATYGGCSLLTKLMGGPSDD